MNLEAHFALGLKYSKHSGRLWCQIPVEVHEWSSTSLFWASVFGVRAQEGVWAVSSLFQAAGAVGGGSAPPSLGEVFAVHGAGFGKWWNLVKGVSYSDTSSLITWALWQSDRSLFFLGSWYHNKQRRRWDLAGWKERVTRRLWWEPTVIDNSVSAVFLLKECS